MSLATLLLAGMVCLQDQPVQTPPPAKISGKEVAWTFKTARPAPYPDEVVQWPGWGFLPTAERKLPRVFRTYQLPPDIEAQYTKAHANITEATPLWPIKVVVFRESDLLDQEPSGVLRRRFSTVEPFQVEDLTQAMGRLGGLIEIATGGSVKPQIEVEVDNEPQRFATNGASPWGEAFAKSYFGPRLNGDGFEADDKVYRGPYGSIFYVHPGLTSDAATETWVNDSPVCGISLATGSFGMSAANLDAPLLLAWEREAYRSGRERGAPEDYVPAAADWPLLSNRTEINAADQAKLMTPRVGDTNVLRKFSGLFGLSPNSENVSLALTQDPEKGSVLAYAESGLYRGGGAAVPSVSSSPMIRVGNTPYLSFYVKSTSKDPIALTVLTTSDRPLEIVLGPMPSAPPNERDPRVVPVTFSNDGTWQHVVVDLSKQLDMSKGPAIVTGMRLGPPTASTRLSKLTVGKITYDFASFQTSAEVPGAVTPQSEPAVSDLSATGEESRALGLAKLTGEASKQDLDAAERLLADPSNLVRLNAAMVFTRAKSSTVVPALIQATKSIDPRISQAAVEALAFQDSDVAWQGLRNALLNGPFDAAREAAAQAIGTKKDASTAGLLSTVIDSRSRLAKMAAIDALSALPGDKAPLIALAFLNQDDPEIRLRATQRIPATRPEVLRQLLYSAVNDTSDQIRWESYRKLLGASNDEFKSEAYKGVRDDGVLVRLALVQSFADQPNEEQRPALRLAVTDVSPRVRAAALRALAKLPKGVEPEEVENTFSDTNPLVQEALLDVAEKSALKLPKETLEAMKGSSVPRIAARAKALG